MFCRAGRRMGIAKTTKPLPILNGGLEDKLSDAIPAHREAYVSSAHNGHITHRQKRYFRRPDLSDLCKENQFQLAKSMHLRKSMLFK
jgi:hypothetical protein